jgi:uncharacterized protein YodC (DUF2158 family)
MPNSFKQGDTVQLKSGGPKMTITHKMDDGKWAVAWFDGNVPKTFVFPPDSLVAAEESK